MRLPPLLFAPTLWLVFYFHFIFDFTVTSQPTLPPAQLPAPAQLPPHLRVLYPFASRYLQVPGGRLHYLDEAPQGGEAEADGESATAVPVLMLHGNPTWSFFYREVVRELVGAGHRCIAPDHIGCGLSDKPQSGFGYTLEEHIANVVALVEHLGLREFDLIVHDWGGAIGMGVATRMPERVRRMVIMNTAAFRSQDIPARIALCRVPLLGELIVRGFNGFAWPATFMAVSRKPLPREVKEGFLFPYDNWRERIATHRFVKAIPLKPGHENYATLTAVEEGLPLLNKKPKLLLWGGKDFCFNDRFLKRWQEIYPDAHTHYIADAGHYLLEDASGECLEQIRAFLAPTDD